MQIFHCVKKPWTKEEKNVALSLYYKSPSSYKFLIRQGFKIPSIKTLQRWINVYNLKAGFSDEVFEKIYTKARTMTRNERDCVLMWDEMSIKKNLHYNEKNDYIEGFEDLGLLGRRSSMATHALLFMLRGLKSPWKLPLAFLLSENSVRASDLTILICICIDRVFRAGLNVRAVVCDMLSTNCAAYSSLGATIVKPFFHYLKNKIYCMYDPPHLIKSVRNTLMKNDIIVQNKCVSWKDIKLFYELDKNNNTGCRAAPKLSERHINPRLFDKMKVKLATQVFSSSVARGMRAAQQLGLLTGPSVEGTIEFISALNDITDALNSRHPDDKCPLRRPLSKANPQVEDCMNEFLRYVKKWKINKIIVTKKGVQKQMPNPPCFNGLIGTLLAELGLYKDLENEGNKYMLTSRLNQDPLENMFGVLRQRGGYNSNPTSNQFRQSLQHSMSIRLMEAPETANCCPDDETVLELGEINQDHSISDCEDPTCDTFMDLPNCIDKLNQVSKENVEEIVQTPGDDILDCKNSTSTLEDSAINYLAGWLLFRTLNKFSCISCHEFKSVKSD